MNQMLMVKNWNYLATHLKKLATLKCVATPCLRTTDLETLSVMGYVSKNRLGTAVWEDERKNCNLFSSHANACKSNHSLFLAEEHLFNLAVRSFFWNFWFLCCPPAVVNFTNILRATFLYESFVQAICSYILCLYFFGATIAAQKLLLKCCWNWQQVSCNIIVRLRRLCKLVLF